MNFREQFVFSFHFSYRSRVVNNIVKCQQDKLFQLKYVEVYKTNVYKKGLLNVVQCSKSITIKISWNYYFYALFGSSESVKREYASEHLMYEFYALFYTCIYHGF